VAARIGAAVMPCVLGLADLPSHTVKSTLPTDIRCFTDPVDAVTGHGIVKFEIVTQPKS
jgi:hypothetical protein